MASRVVLWGGRPGVDIQFGSDFDRQLSKLTSDMVRLSVRLVGDLVGFGVSAADANSVLRVMARQGQSVAMRYMDS